MALDLLYSFDWVNTAVLPTLPNVITNSPGCTASPNEGRDGSGCLVVTDGLNSIGNIAFSGFNFAVQPWNDISIGMWVSMNGLPGTNAILFAYGNPGVLTSNPGLVPSDKIITVSPGGDGSISVWMGEFLGLIGRSASGIFNYDPAVPHYIEMRVVIATVGLLLVKVDGQTVINLPSVLTQYFGQSEPTHVMLGNPLGSSRTKFDDIFYCNGINNGDGWTAPRGVVQVDGKLVNAAGDVAQWTPSNPTGSNFTNVAETIPDQHTFNATSTLGFVDLYNVTDVGYIPIGVQLDLFMKKQDNGPSSVSPVVRTAPAGANITGTANPLSTGFKYYKQAYGANPGGVPWTQANFNALQVGVVKAE